MMFMVQVGTGIHKERRYEVLYLDLIGCWTTGQRIIADCLGQETFLLVEITGDAG